MNAKQIKLAKRADSWQCGTCQDDEQSKTTATSRDITSEQPVTRQKSQPQRGLKAEHKSTLPPRHAQRGKKAKQNTILAIAGSQGQGSESQQLQGEEMELDEDETTQETEEPQPQPQVSQVRRGRRMSAIALPDAELAPNSNLPTPSLSLNQNRHFGEEDKENLSNFHVNGIVAILKQLSDEQNSPDDYCMAALEKFYEERKLHAQQVQEQQQRELELERLRQKEAAEEEARIQRETERELRVARENPTDLAAVHYSEVDENSPPFTKSRDISPRHVPNLPKSAFHVDHQAVKVPFVGRGMLTNTRSLVGDALIPALTPQSSTGSVGSTGEIPRTYRSPSLSAALAHIDEGDALWNACL